MRTITKCRSCGSSNLTTILDLGEQHLSDFRDDDQKTPKYPLDVVFCDGCKLVQLRHTTPSSEMYHERYGFKSGVSDSIKADLKDLVRDALVHQPDPNNWLDIASNDGTLLSYVPAHVYRVGIDPIKKYCLEAEQHADSIVNDFFAPHYFYARSKFGEFDIITSCSMFYDLDDPNKFVDGVRQVLARKGVWMIQQNYLLTTMQLNAIDNVCHEHLEYYSLLSLQALLERHGLQIIDCSTSMVNGGSIRTAVAFKDVYEVSESVGKQLAKELSYGMNDLSTYRGFGSGVMKKMGKLYEFVKAERAKGRQFVILAASTRGATIWQSAGLGPELIDYAVERNPEKVGKNFSAIGIPIKSEEYFRADQPDYAIIGPWFFETEIVWREAAYLKKGGQLIVPLPGFKVISND